MWIIAQSGVGIIAQTGVGKKSGVGRKYDGNGNTLLSGIVLCL
jgi:hypothetical protein